MICTVKEGSSIIILVGAKARRLRVDNQDGTTNIPAVTPAAEHLSTLTTLKEVQRNWTRTTGIATTTLAPPFGGLFGLGALAARPPVKKRTRTPVM